MERASGVLLHISSLPGPYGIGRLGRAAYDFVDFLKETGQSYWQILPLTTTSYGDSPYQSFSAFAGNTNFIDFDILLQDGWLEPSDLESVDFGSHPEKIDYHRVFESQRKVLSCAVQRFLDASAQHAPDFQNYLSNQEKWLGPFAQYMTVKEFHDLKPYDEWPDEFRFYDSERVREFCQEHQQNYWYHLITQYWFSKQWLALKKYANQSGIRIIGDIPIYVARDSVEMWTQPELFHTDEKGHLITVAGTPPDAFTSDGQFWGNPIYHWEKMRQQGYQWWIERIKANFELYDVVRIDHFRGFESYWEIPSEAESAKEGYWVKGPGRDFFRSIERQLGRLNIIAEDLGYITDDVRDLLDWTGYPGMKVLQFAFDGHSDSSYLPHHHIQNSVAYVGTHDNETALGHYQSTSQEEREQIDRYLNRLPGENPAHAYNRGIAASVSQLAIYTMQDLLQLGNEARMNTPSTIGGNWQWRMVPDAITTEVKSELLELTQTYFRMNEYGGL